MFFKVSFSSRIFTISPASQEIFTDFSDVPFEELPDNESFCAHALQVADAIGMVVWSLNDLDGLVVVLKDLGAAHCNHTLKEEHFDVS